MTPLRIIAHIALLAAVTMLSYPIFLILVVIFIFLFEWPYDVLIWAVISDAIYSVPLGSGIHFSVLLTVVLLLIVGMFAKTQLLFRGY